MNVMKLCKKNSSSQLNFHSPGHLLLHEVSQTPSSLLFFAYQVYTLMCLVLGSEKRNSLCTYWTFHWSSSWNFHAVQLLLLSHLVYSYMELWVALSLSNWLWTHDFPCHLSSYSCLFHKPHLFWHHQVQPWQRIIKIFWKTKTNYTLLWNNQKGMFLMKSGMLGYILQKPKSGPIEGSRQ